MSLKFQHISESISSEQAIFLKSYFGEHYPYLFYNASSIPEYFYNKGLVWVDILSIEEESLNYLRVVVRIDNMNKLVSQWEESNDYVSIFFQFGRKGLLLQMFVYHFSVIPIEQRYDIFRDIYTESEYNFSALSLDFLENVFALSEYSEDWHQDIKELESVADSEGFITIYRGECSKSTPLKNAWSWTLSYETALFFATRFSDKGIVYQTRILYKDVLDYFAENGEEEILIHPKNIIDYDKKRVSR